MTHEELTLGQASKYLNRHPKTLQGWDREGVLPARRTKSNRRYWLKSDLDQFLSRKYLEEDVSIVILSKRNLESTNLDLENKIGILKELIRSQNWLDTKFIEEIYLK